ncbi:MAG: nuclear transport factor 2 family protein [Anaerolineae bacterium]|nr:nuclear transport factor 2 family protein [Anaerolineae bacterium]
MNPARMERLEAATRVALAFYDALARGDMPAMLPLVSDDCILESAAPPPQGERRAGKQAVSAFWQALLQHTPPADLKIEEVFSTATRCVVRWQCAGARGVDILRVSQGRICEMLRYVKG